MDWAELAMYNLEEPAAPQPIEPVGVRMSSENRSDGEAVWRLRSAGYPAKLVAEFAGYGLDGATLKCAFTIVPHARALPSAPGALIAIVGPGKRSSKLATLVAEEIDVDTTTLALTTSDDAVDRLQRTFEAGFVAPGLDEIADLSTGWRRDRVGVVTVSCDAFVASYTWARSALCVMVPTYVILVTKAAAKNEDVVKIADLIGGVDALFVERLSESMTPLTSLGTGIPVSRIDGSRPLQARG